MNKREIYLMKARRVYGIRVYWRVIFNPLMKYYWAGVSIESALKLMKDGIY